MKNIRILLFLSLCIFFLQALQSQNIDYQKIGDNMAATIASVEPGETVLIAGGEYSLRVMEAIAIGVYKQGGSPIVVTETDKMSTSLFTDMPEKLYLDWTDPLIKLMSDADVVILIPTSEKNEEWQAVFNNISEARRKRWEALNQKGEEAIMQAKTRVLIFSMPTEGMAQVSGLDFETYTSKLLNGLTADFMQIRKTGERLVNLLEQSKEVRITTDGGTDITFQTTGRKCLISDGRTTSEDMEKPLMDRVETVPGGMIQQTVHERSADGTLFIPKMRCDGLPKVENLSVSFSEGMMEVISGEGKDCVEEALKSFEKEARLLGQFSIGLNTAMQVNEEGGVNFRPSLAAGMVYLYLGNNQYRGGENTVEGTYNLPLTNATVTIDGVVVIKDGVLQELK